MEEALKEIYKYRDFIDTLSSPWFRVVAKSQHVIQQATHAYSVQNGLQYMNLPVTTGSISSPMGLGSDSLPVSVELFGEKTYLADSMQFALEFGCRLSPQGSYYIMPSFRGEAPDETHLCQFFHSEAEIPGDLDAVIEYTEGYVRHLCRAMSESLKGELEDLIGETSHIFEIANIQEPFPQIKFREVRRLFKDDPKYIKETSPGTYTVTRAAEARLIEEVGPIVWLVEPEYLSVPFYQAYCDDTKRYAQAADLLFGPGEVIGAGERHAHAEQVRDALQRHRVSLEDYAWYIRMREVYPVQTAGFGLGVERFLMWAFKHNDIRDFELLPRVNGLNLTP